MKLRHLFAPLMLGAALLSFSASESGASSPADITSTYDFSGVCQDCMGDAGAELTLLNYTPGQTIDASNFVSFHYDGTNLLEAFTVTAADADYVNGDLTTLPGPNNFYLASDSEFFSSSSFGNWCVGGACDSDYGFQHTWSISGVPEPTTWFLIIVGIAGVGLVMRRAKATSAAVA
jgi:hypothetical protein